MLESDLEGPTPAAVRDAEETTGLEWLTDYVKANVGVARGKAETAFHEAHNNHGRNLARRIIDAQIGLAATSPETREYMSERRDLPTLAAGPGETKHGIYLYPAIHALSPLAALPNGETGETSATPSANGLSPLSPPPIEGVARVARPLRVATPQAIQTTTKTRPRYPASTSSSPTAQVQPRPRRGQRHEPRSFFSQRPRGYPPRSSR